MSVCDLDFNDGKPWILRFKLKFNWWMRIRLWFIRNFMKDHTKDAQIHWNKINGITYVELIGGAGAPYYTVNVFADEEYETIIDTARYER